MLETRLFEPGAASLQRVDRYDLIGEIASGGMATVYLARLTGVGGFQRLVAIKRLHPHLAAEKEFVEMFLDEARLAARIHHPNVVSILEVGASSGGYYLAMEYIEGDTLARIVSRAATRSLRVPASVTLRAGLDMLAGLHAAHELRDDEGNPVNLVHRDVSPQNVLIGSDGIVRITDFGVARAASRLSATRVGQLKGKIAYMAPEQAQGDPLDRRADVFSAGVVLWEALAARRLFKGDNETATLTRVMSEPIPDLHPLAPNLPREVSVALMRALSRAREERYASAAEFADALEAAARGRQEIASAKELQAYVQDVMGEDIARQREGVRAWIAQSDREGVGFPSPALPSSSVTASTLTVSDVPRSFAEATLPEGPRRSRALRATLLGLLLVLVGGAGFYAARLGSHADGDLTGAPLAAPVLGAEAGVQSAARPPEKVETPAAPVSAPALVAPTGPSASPAFGGRPPRAGKNPAGERTPASTSTTQLTLQKPRKRPAPPKNPYR